MSKKTRKQKRPRKKGKNKPVSINKKKEINFPVITEIPNPFKSLNAKQRKEVIEKLGEESRQKLDEAIEKLDSYITKFNPVQILSLLAYYGLTKGAGDSGVQRLTKSIDINQSSVEFIQARILQFDISKLGKSYPTPDIFVEIIDLLKEIERSFSFSRMNSNVLDASDEDKAIYTLQEHVRMDTQVVRNWGYQSQVKTISKELYCNFDNKVNEAFGFSITDTINTFSQIQAFIEGNVSKRFQFLKELIRIKKSQNLFEKYCDKIGYNLEDRRVFGGNYDFSEIKRKELFYSLMTHYDQILPIEFFVDDEKLSKLTGLKNQKIKLILDKFSYRLDALKAYETKYIFLDNPIWSKPLIKYKGGYFCPMPQLFFSFILLAIDELLVVLDKKEVAKRRSEYLEDKINVIVKHRFPDTKTVSRVKWTYKDKLYETDLISIIDTHLLIIEAKSHRITQSALRGAPERIKKHLKQVFLDPSEQSYRLENKINDLKKNFNPNDELVKNLPSDIRKINKIVRISVCLDNFGSLQANLREIMDTGWFKVNFYPCPIMSLADFESVFDFLEHPVQLIHYFIRRQEMESQYDIHGDELDLLGLYKDTLFNLGDLPNNNLTITGMSADIDHYYESRDIGKPVKKPKPKISLLFSDIFYKLEKRETLGWTEIGTILSRFSPDDQINLERAVKKYIIIVNKSWSHPGHKNIILNIPPLASEYALAYVLYKNGNKEKKKEFVETAAIMAFNYDHVQKCIVIAKNIDLASLGYDFVGLFAPAHT